MRSPYCAASPTVTKALLRARAVSLEALLRTDVRAAAGPKYKAALATAYGAGLRVSEVVALKVTDVHSTRMMLRIEQGKDRKNRPAMLSPPLLKLLRARWRERHQIGVMLPGGWPFPGAQFGRSAPCGS